MWIFRLIGKLSLVYGFKLKCSARSLYWSHVASEGLILETLIDSIEATNLSIQSFDALMNVSTLPLKKYMDELEPRLDHETFWRLSQLETTKSRNIMAKYNRMFYLQNSHPESISHANPSHIIEYQVSTQLNLLSTSTFCQLIGSENSLGSHAWLFIDGDCLMSACTISLWPLVTNLLPSETEDLFDAILRYQQVLANLEYIDSFHDCYRRGTLKKLFFEAVSGHMKHLEGRPEIMEAWNKSDKLAYFRMLYFLIMQRVEVKYRYSRVEASDELLLPMFWSELMKQWEGSSSEADKRKSARSLINCAVSMIRHANPSFLIKFLHLFTRESILVKAQSKDLYILLITVISRRCSDWMPFIGSVWNVLLSRHTTHEILVTNSSHFGLLCDFVTVNQAKAAYRFWLSVDFPATSIVYLVQNMVEQIITIQLNHFITLERKTTKYILPKLEIHPFVEMKFLKLINCANICRLSLPFKLLPTYLKYLASDGAQPGLVEDLVKVIVKYQFMTPSLDTNPSNLDSLQLVDSLRKQIRNGQLSTSIGDYLAFVRHCRNNKSFLKSIWSGERRMEDDLVEHGITILTSKSSMELLRIPVGNLDSSRLSSFLHQ